METIQAYRAVDGRIFTSESDCERHENNLIFEKHKVALHRRINITTNKLDAFKTSLRGCRTGLFNERSINLLEEQASEVFESVKLFAIDVFGVVNLDGTMGASLDISRGTYVAPKKICCES